MARYQTKTKTSPGFQELDPKGKPTGNTIRVGDVDVGTLPADLSDHLIDLEDEEEEEEELCLDYHRRRAASMFGVAPEDVTEEQRQEAKRASFGRLYTREEDKTDD